MGAGHAILDVFATEPLPPEHPFWAHPAITVLPHVAAWSTLENCLPVALENLRRLRAGEPPAHPTRSASPRPNTLSRALTRITVAAAMTRRPAPAASGRTVMS